MNAQGALAGPVASLLMLVAGIGIPAMAAINAGLGRHLGSPAAATATLYAIALLAMLPVLMVTGLPPRAAFGATPGIFYAGALLNILYVFGITWAAPRIGIGNAVMLVLLGQIISSAAIDHFALFGAARSLITPRRALGMAAMALGVYLARKPV